MAVVAQAGDGCMVLLESLKNFRYLHTLLSLRTVLIVPFILQIFVAVGLTGYLSFRNGLKAVNAVAAQLRTEISKRVQQNLQTYLETPHQINQSNAIALTMGELDVQDFTKLERHFFNQLKIFKGVNLVGFANPNRELYL